MYYFGSYIVRFGGDRSVRTSAIVRTADIATRMVDASAWLVFSCFLCSIVDRTGEWSFIFKTARADPADLKIYPRVGLLFGPQPTAKTLFPLILLELNLIVIAPTINMWLCWITNMTPPGWVRRDHMYGQVYQDLCCPLRVLV